jgi:hypothetical protein
MRLQMSKGALKKLRRKEREAEQQNGNRTNESDEEDEVEGARNGSNNSPQPPAFILAMAAPAPALEPVNRIVDCHPPPPVAIQTPVAPTCLPIPPVALVSPPAPVFIPPQGMAGELLAMLVSSSATSTTTAHIHPNGNGHSVALPPSSTLPISSSLMNRDQPPSSSSYFKSKSGFTIRLE